MTYSTTHTDDNGEFEGDGGAIFGVAEYTVDIEDDMSGDIGGKDGQTVTCQLLNVNVGGLILDRDQIVTALSEVEVRKIEARLDEQLQAEVDAGDWGMAA